MRWEQTVEFATLTDVGLRRRNNEDSSGVLIASEATSFLSRGHLFMVADGMGGHAVGELASKIAVDTIPLAFQKHAELPLGAALATAIEEANTAIHQRGEQNADFRRMGTTCTTLVLSPAGALAGHVGDSRLYRIRGHRIDQLTFDHSYVWELMRTGRYRLEDVLLQHPKNIITRCLGPEAKVQVDLEGPYPVLPGDTYTLCTDGLSNLVKDEEIGMIARNLSPVQACRLLVDLANLRGGSDNITVVIARIGDLPEGVSPEHSVVSMPIVESPGLGWEGFTAWSIWGLLTAGAISMIITGRVLEGLLSLGIMLIVFGVLIIVSMRILGRQQRPTGESDPQATVIWRPYRTANFRLSSEFLGMLAGLEQTLQSTALEEGWSINWNAHKEAYEAATAALSEKIYDSALQSLSEAIHTLMSGIQSERRRIDHAAKWGEKTPMPPNKSSSSKGGDTKPPSEKPVTEKTEKSVVDDSAPKPDKQRQTPPPSIRQAPAREP